MSRQPCIILSVSRPGADTFLVIYQSKVTLHLLGSESSSSIKEENDNLNSSFQRNFHGQQKLAINLYYKLLIEAVQKSESK